MCISEQNPEFLIKEVFYQKKRNNFHFALLTRQKKKSDFAPYLCYLG